MSLHRRAGRRTANTAEVNMSSWKSKSLAFACMAIASVTAGLGLAVGTHAQGASDRPFAIEGGWLFTVTPPPGTPGPASFTSLDSFAAGGGWSGHASIDAQTNLSPAYGTWKRTRDGVVVTQVQFSQDPAGSPSGTVIILKQVRFTSRDTLQGISQLSFCDLNGQNCVTLPGHANVFAIRIETAAPTQ
jgi:hypothetical protein